MYAIVLIVIPAHDVKQVDSFAHTTTSTIFCILAPAPAPSCFYGKDTVNLVRGGRRSIENLIVGDRIWSLNHQGTRLIEDQVIMMADNGPNRASMFHLYIDLMIVSSLLLFFSFILYISYKRWK